MIRFTKAKHKLIKPKQSIKKQAALQKLNSFLNQQEPEAVEFLYRDLQGMQNAITYKELREAYLAGGITDEQFEEWQLGYAAMVDTALKPGWEEAAAQAAAEVKAKYPDFVYDPSVSASMEWLNQHGAELVTNLKQEQKQAINTMIAHCSGYTAVTPDEAARIIRPTIGLTVPQAVANARYRETVKQAYLDAHPRANPATAEKKAADAAAKYGARQHRYRAQSIARTELAFGYNAGHHGAIKDAMSQGFMGDCTKTWLTAYDERVCPECSHMDNETVNIDAFFSNGVEIPPAHPHCRCAVAYDEIDGTNMMPETDEEEKPFMEITGEYTGERDEDEIGQFVNPIRGGSLTTPRTQGTINPEERQRAGETFPSTPGETLGRRISYGEEQTFERDSGNTTARKVENFAENNLYAATDIKTTKTALRRINGQITAAKEKMGITGTCNIPIVVTKSKESIAAYNPRTNVMFISPEFGNKKAIKRLQAGYACPDNPISTAVHELFHWEDANAYRLAGGIIDTADDVTAYTVSQRLKALNELEALGVDLTQEEAIRAISPYAYESLLANDYEELLTEIRTKNLLEGTP